MRVSVVVPAYNAAETIGKTIAALAAQDLAEPYEVIVVDDGSGDETVAIAEGTPGPIRVIRQDHQGPGPGRNRGVGEARADLIAFTDADCFPTRGWLRAGLAALKTADLVQGKVIADAKARRGPYDRTVWVLNESGLYETANLFIRRDLFLRLGGFEDWLPARIGKPLAEDVWLGWRARRAGARTAFSEEALVHHAVFRRGPLGHIGERRRLIYFPAMAQKMPELKQTFFYRRRFLNRRSAEFDLALLGVLAAGVLLATAGTVLAAVPLLGVLPYARTLLERAVHWGRYAPRVAVVDLAADTVGFAALAWGSARRRTVVL